MAFVGHNVQMRLFDRPCFSDYEKEISGELPELVAGFQSQELDLGYNLKASSVYSSNIEGNSLNLNSYMNLKMRKDLGKNKEIKEIDDLVEAYEYARTKNLTEKTFLETHRLLSRTILIKSKQGKYRQEPIGVFSDRGLVYLAVEPNFVHQHMTDLFTEIEDLLKSNLVLEEVFYFASLVHLRFVHIHPFSDGNGRAARILEKWFIVQKLGERFWGLLSEKNYKTYQKEYYENINLGVNFYVLDYSKSLPFLRMLLGSVKGTTF